MARAAMQEAFVARARSLTRSAMAADLPAGAAEGQVVFIGDFAARDGEFWQLIDGSWRSTDEED